MQFDTHTDVRSYEDSIVLAVEKRTNRVVEDVTLEGRLADVTLDQAPTDSELAEVDDVLEATERYRQAVNGATVTYELQPVDPSDANLPDAHMTLDQRISQLVGDVGDLGKNVGGVAPSDVTARVAGKPIEVSLPAGASQEAEDRVRTAMLAFGKVEQ